MATEVTIREEIVNIHELIACSNVCPDYYNDYIWVLNAFLRFMLDEDPLMTLSNDRLSQELSQYFLDNLLVQSCTTLMSVKCDNLPAQSNSEHQIRDCIQILIRIGICLLSNGSVSHSQRSAGIHVLQQVMDVSSSFCQQFGQDWVCCAQNHQMLFTSL